MVIRDSSVQEDFWRNPSSPRNQLVESLKHASEKFETFRTSWYNDYLLSLREISRDLYQVPWKNLVKVGDIVLIKAPVKERPYWQMGIVTQLVYGDDNKVRSVYVRSPGGQTNLHAIKNLYPLELSLTHNGSSVQNSEQPSASNTPTDYRSNNTANPYTSQSDREIALAPSERPKRLAALKARANLVESEDELSSESD